MSNAIGMRKVEEVEVLLCNNWVLIVARDAANESCSRVSTSSEQLDFFRRFVVMVIRRVHRKKEEGRGAHCEDGILLEGNGYL